MLAPGTRDNRNVFCADSCSPLHSLSSPNSPGQQHSSATPGCTEFERTTQSLQTCSRPLFRPLLAASPCVCCSLFAARSLRPAFPGPTVPLSRSVKLCSSKHQAASGSSAPIKLSRCSTRTDARLPNSVQGSSSIRRLPLGASSHLLSAAVSAGAPSVPSPDLTSKVKVLTADKIAVDPLARGSVSFRVPCGASPPPTLST